MFNSQKINNDPEPVVYPDGARTDGVGWLPLPNDGIEYAPRPEYDNNPNPILVAVRYVSEKHGLTPEETVKLAEMWLRAPRYYESNQKVKSTKDHREHAYKVLTRLVNIFGTEEDR